MTTQTQKLEIERNNKAQPEACPGRWEPFEQNLRSFRGPEDPG